MSALGVIADIFGTKADIRFDRSRTAVSCPLLGVKRTCLFALQMSAFDPKRTRAPTHCSGNPWQTDARNKFHCRGFVGSARSERCPNPIYSSHPNSPLEKPRRVPTAAEQCGCTILRELARPVANSSHSVAPSALNNVRRSSNMKTSPQRANGAEDGE